jgi:uncharacterized membrane protein (UPF0127 family)
MQPRIRPEPRGVAAACLAAWLAGASHAHAVQPDSPLGFAGWPRVVVEIRGRDGPQRFQATVADTPERQQQGLMYVLALDADESMWFPQPRPRAMQMWMKDTLIPLDMLFVGANGHVACIVAHARPESLALITCATPASGVLEIGAGEAERRGIRRGARLRLRPK